MIGAQVHARAWELLLRCSVMEAAFGIPGLIADRFTTRMLKIACEPEARLEERLGTERVERLGHRGPWLISVCLIPDHLRISDIFATVAESSLKMPADDPSTSSRSRIDIQLDLMASQKIFVLQVSLKARRNIEPILGRPGGIRVGTGNRAVSWMPT